MGGKIWPGLVLRCGSGEDGTTPRAAADRSGIPPHQPPSLELRGEIVASGRASVVVGSSKSELPQSGPR